MVRILRYVRDPESSWRSGILNRVEDLGLNNGESEKDEHGGKYLDLTGSSGPDWMTGPKVVNLQNLKLWKTVCNDQKCQQ